MTLDSCTRALVALTLTCVASLAATTAWADTPVRGAKTDSAEYVVLKAGTELRIDPAADQSWSTDRDFAVRVIEDTAGDVLHVETDPTMNSEPWIASEVLHCQVPLQSHGMALRFYVAADALLPVIAKKTTVEHDDETSITLLPGTVVEPLDDETGRYRIELGDVVVKTALPDDAVGPRYAPDTARFHPPEAPKALSSAATLWVGDEKVRVHSRTALPVASQSGDRVALENGCWSIVARVDAGDDDTAVVEPAGGQVLANLFTVGADEELVARPGSKVYWPALEPIEFGRVVYPQALTGERDAHGDLRCFNVRIGGVGLAEPSAKPIRASNRVVCFESGDLETRKNAGIGEAIEGIEGGVGGEGLGTPPASGDEKTPRDLGGRGTKK